MLSDEQIAAIKLRIYKTDHVSEMDREFVATARREALEEAIVKISTETFEFDQDDGPVSGILWAINQVRALIDREGEE